MVSFLSLFQVNKTSSSIRVTPSNRNSTISSIATQNETQMLRLLNSAAQKREVKATQNLSIIVAFFMICWIPLYTINCINAFCRQCFINESVIYFGIILSHLNSALNPLLYAYHLKDFRGALLRLFTCKNEQDSYYRPSIVTQQQNRISSQIVQRRSFQPKVYIDSPIWKRTQRQLQLQTITEAKKSNDVDSGFFRDTDLSTEAHPSPALQRRHSSQSNQIFVISGNETESNSKPNTSSLYRIANRNENEHD
jgi:hypothetical protein